MAMPWPWPGHHGQNSMPGTTPLLYTEVDSQCESGWDAGWPLQQGAFLLYFWAVAGSWCFFLMKIPDVESGSWYSSWTFQLNLPVIRNIRNRRPQLDPPKTSKNTIDAHAWPKVLHSPEQTIGSTPVGRSKAPNDRVQKLRFVHGLFVFQKWGATKEP